MDFGSVFTQFAAYITREYGVVVAIKSLPPDMTGDFDGTHIAVRADLDAEIKLFILAHLFGHTVQFNTSATLRQIGVTSFTAHNINPDIMSVIQLYEQEAGQYGLAVLHALGIFELDQWLSDWVWGDWSYLKLVYETKRAPEIVPEQIKLFKNKYVHSGSKIIAPLPVPPFTPQIWEKRASF